MSLYVILYLNFIAWSSNESFIWIKIVCLINTYLNFRCRSAYWTSPNFTGIFYYTILLGFMVYTWRFSFNTTCEITINSSNFITVLGTINFLRGIIMQPIMCGSESNYIIIKIIFFNLIDSFMILLNLLDVIEVPQNNAMNETMAIDAIQKTLMLCETAVNSTSSSITMPATPPAYSTAVSSFSSRLSWINLVYPY